MEKLKVGLFGFGCVGQGFYNILTATQNDTLEVSKIVVKHKNKPRSLSADHFSYEKEEILNDPSIQVVVEAIDDYHASYEIVSAALKNKKHVVTSNKKMLAYHLKELIELQQEYGVSLLYEATSCGSIPIIRTLEEYFGTETLNGVEGIFNGTTNFILSKIFNDNLSYSLALKHAQDLGFAESDPSNDVNGFDAKFKLIIIALHAFGIELHPSEVFSFGISNISSNDIRYARINDIKIKLVPKIIRHHDELIAYVIPQFVSSKDSLYSIENEFNAVSIDAPYSGEQFFKGKGAGSYPTGSAVLKDLLSLNQKYRYRYLKYHQQKKKGESKHPLLVEVYLSYQSDFVINKLQFESISERSAEGDHKYVIGYITLNNLIDHLPLLVGNHASVIGTGKTKSSAEQVAPKRESLVAS